MSGPASDWRRWTERRLASFKTTYANAVDKVGSEAD